MGFSIIETEVRDAREQEGQFDVVLADVPCSGLGVIRKKPEIRYKDPTTISALPEIQLSVLHGLASCVRPGGVLLYSTCTILPEENEEIIKAFLKENSSFSLEPTIWTPEGMRTFWPHLDGTDGFFIAKMRNAL